MTNRLMALLLGLLLVRPAMGEESVCHGSTARGSLENACELPAGGANFSPYSFLGPVLGRTYVHCTVRTIVEEAYEALAAAYPRRRFPGTPPPSLSARCLQPAASELTRK